MRIDTQEYAIINQNANREPRYVVKVSFGGDPIYDYFITSHDDCEVPSGTPVADISYNTLRDLSGTSQRINPIKALSTIGTMQFSVVDYENTITDKIKEQYGDVDGEVTATDRGLRDKVIEFYVGEKGLDWDNYILIQTQIVRSVTLKDGYYTFRCADVQRTTRDTIFDINRTTLRANMDATQTVVPSYLLSDFETLVHGDSYTDLPNETVGYIEIKDEVIAWRKKLETDITYTQSDVSFSGNVISSTLIDFTNFDVGQQIEVSGSGSNDGVYNIHPSTAPTTNTLTVVESLTTETAGASVTIFAEVQFYDCVRGVLNTKAVEHVMSDPLPTSDRREKIEEIVYLELPAPKLMYAILTGSLYGSADVLPSNWHLNISTDFVATTEFINIGTDYWNTADDTAGFPVRFLSPKRTSGKKFIEEELLLLGGLYMPILADGQLGLRRMTNVLSNASALMVLDERNVVSISELKHNMEAVHNQFDINWNWDRKEKRFTRSYTIVDGDSITRHGAATPTTMNFQGLHGSSSTDALIIAQIDGARDRYAGPPEEITVTCLFSCNALEIGDIVRLELENLQDFVEGGSISRSFEVQEVRTDWRTGNVKLKLFGSSQPAESIAKIATESSLTNTFYTSEGTDISTVTTGSGTTKWTISSDSEIYGGETMSTVAYSTGTLTATNGSQDITGSGTAWATSEMASINIGGVIYPILLINSNTSITLAAEYTGSTGGGKVYTSYNAVYYYDGDLEIASGVTLTIHNNVQLRINGDITVNGTIDGTGNGLQSDYRYDTTAEMEGAWPDLRAKHPPKGLIGAIGTTQPPGSYWGGGDPTTQSTTYHSYPSEITVGKWSSVPRMGLINTGDVLYGLPDDLRGTSGGMGQPFVVWLGILKIPGGHGGGGGAGMVVVTKNLYSGLSGAINLHGGNGEKAEGLYIAEYNTYYGDDGYGAGGGAGGLLIVIDGAGTADTSTVNQYHGITTLGLPPLEAPDITIPWSEGTNWSSYYTGLGRRDATDFTNQRTDYTRVQYVDPIATAEVDVPDETTVASVITLVEVAAANTTLNQTAIEISVTAPVGSGAYIDNYKASHVYARNTTTADSWFDIGEVGTTGELSFMVLADGTTWEVKAHAVSLSNVESEDYISDTITITTQLETVIGTGNKIVTSVAPDVSGGVSLDETGITGYDGTGTAKVTIDGTTGVITATDAVLSGTISATAGAIGGWDISSTAIDFGTGASHMELNPTSGIWMGADLIGNAPFSVTNAGVLVAQAGNIGGWSVNSTSIQSPNQRVVLDSTNNRIQVEDAVGTNYTRIDADGVTGVDSVLGTVFRLPTDGTAPSFSSGIINSTVFNITSAGILETSSTVGDGGASGQGVRINDTGIKGYKINNATPIFTLDATDGSMTCSDATISGTITVGAGSSGVSNLSDAGDLATSDRVDLLYADGADVTSVNTAASISGQGDLATQNTADFATDVIGAEKPADNADVTTPMQVAAKINYTSFTAANQGEIFIHGYNADGVLADVNGVIIYNNSSVSLPKDYTNPNLTCEGYIVYRPTNWADGRKYAIGVPNSANSYSWSMYYSGTTNQVTLAVTDIVIGVARNSGSEVTESGAVWGYGVGANTLVSYGADVTGDNVAASITGQGDLAVRDTVNGSYIDNLSVDTLQIANRATFDYSYVLDSTNYTISTYDAWEEVLSSSFTTLSDVPDLITVFLNVFVIPTTWTILTGNYVYGSVKLEIWDGDRDTTGTLINTYSATQVYITNPNSTNHERIDISNLTRNVSTPAANTTYYVYCDVKKVRSTTTSTSLTYVFEGGSLLISTYYK